ncbi:hypothetical protein XENOCAPTIV_006802, partial [Xenoophorus captivus]
EVSGLKCDNLLSSGQFLPTECVSGLVELAGNPNTSPALTSSIISLLAQLGSDDASREILHSSYNLTSTLAAVIHCHSSTPGEPLVLQCLQVLQKLTYNTRTFQFTNYIHELISFLLTNMQFYRTLINFLAHNSLTVVIFTLSILASLTLNEKVGEKLVFNIIVNGDGTLTRKYSVDLLVDLLKNSKIADYLTRWAGSHDQFTTSGQRRKSIDRKWVVVLELLLAMCRIGGLRSQLCDVVFRPAGPKLRPAGHRQGSGADGGRKPECGLALVSAQLCLSQVDVLLSCCHSNSPLTHLPPVSSNDLSWLCAEALLKTLELMSKLRQQVKDMETSFYRMLQVNPNRLPSSRGGLHIHLPRCLERLSRDLSSGPEDRDSPLTGSDVPPQGARSDRTRSAV